MKTSKWYVIIGLHKSTVIFLCDIVVLTIKGGEQVSICVQSVCGKLGHGPPGNFDFGHLLDPIWWTLGLLYLGSLVVLTIKTTASSQFPKLHIPWTQFLLCRTQAVLQHYRERVFLQTSFPGLEQG